MTQQKTSTHLKEGKEMTRTQALERITAKAEAMGLKSGEYNGSTWVSVTGQPGYSHITITEKIDSERCDYKNGVFAGHFEISAEVSRMGGAPTAEELFEAAEQIKKAAEFVKACEEEGFSFTENYAA